MEKKVILASAVFLLCLIVFGVKLFMPAPIQIYVDGRDTTYKQVRGLYSFQDVLAISASAVVCIACAMYLLNPDEGKYLHAGIGLAKLDDNKKRWHDLAKQLKDDELSIYKVIVESDGIINQSEISLKVGISKAEVSRTLDMLESRSILERRRRGMGNVVVLK
jgi:uncharacterized membrane protein